MPCLPPSQDGVKNLGKVHLCRENQTIAALANTLALVDLNKNVFRENELILEKSSHCAHALLNLCFSFHSNTIRAQVLFSPRSRWELGTGFLSLEVYSVPHVVTRINKNNFC